MKRLLKSISASVAIGLLLMQQTVGAGLISATITNLLPGTNVIYTSGARVNQIVISTPGDQTVRFYDSATNSLTQVVGAYTYVTNVPITVTWLQTNGIFVYPTVTNYLIQTNTYVDANGRSNVTVAGATNQYPAAAEIATIAGVTSLADLDLIFIRGISVTTTTNATIILYTNP